MAHRHDHAHACCGGHAHAGPAPAMPSARAAGGALAVYAIQNMDCPAEEALIRAGLKDMPGIRGLDFNLIQRRLTVAHDLPDPGPVQAALLALGMQAVPVEAGPGAAAPAATRRKWLQAALGCLAALAAEVLAWLGGDGGWGVVALALLAIALSGL